MNFVKHYKRERNIAKSKLILAKTNVGQITNEQREELPKQRRKGSKGDFLRKIASALDIQGVNVT